MTKFIALVLASALAGCASTTKLVDPPNLAELPASIAAPCPPAPSITDGSIGAIALADAALATMYADCKSKHAAAVAAYNAARRKRASYNRTSKKSKKLK